MGNFIKEACVDSLHQVREAKRKGADRIELCSCLELDGLTPSKFLITEAQKVGLPLRIMVRPRGGNFDYSEEEIRRMTSTIKMCRDLNIDGVVFGVLKEDGNLNLSLIERLARESYPMKVIVHKAIDQTPDPLNALRELLQIKEVTGVLTSGGKSTAEEGKEILNEMLKIAAEKMEVIVAGKVTLKNLESLHEQLGASAYHGKKIVGDLDEQQEVK